MKSLGIVGTGSVVKEAVIPGRCAEPPAPAMITSIPSMPYILCLPSFTIKC